MPTKWTTLRMLLLIMNLQASWTCLLVRNQEWWRSPRFLWLSTVNEAQRTTGRKTSSMTWITPSHFNHPSRASMSPWEAVCIPSHFRLLTTFYQTGMKDLAVPICSICPNQQCQSNPNRFLLCHFHLASAKRRNLRESRKCKPWKKLRAKLESITETIWGPRVFLWESANCRIKWECKT